MGAHEREVTGQTVSGETNWGSGHLGKRLSRCPISQLIRRLYFAMLRQPPGVDGRKIFEKRAPSR